MRSESDKLTRVKHRTENEKMFLAKYAFGITELSRKSQKVDLTGYVVSTMSKCGKQNGRQFDAAKVVLEWLKKVLSFGQKTGHHWVTCKKR